MGAKVETNEQQLAGAPPAQPAMNIIGGSRIFWVIILLALYMAFRAPMTLSAVLNSIGHVIAVTAGGLTHFLGAATSKSS
jgi:hypothetical protein